MGGQYGGLLGVSSFNPKMKGSGPKNLLKGDSFCIERFELVYEDIPGVSERPVPFPWNRIKPEA